MDLPEIIGSRLSNISGMWIKLDREVFGRNIDVFFAEWVSRDYDRRLAFALCSHTEDSAEGFRYQAPDLSPTPRGGL